MSNHRNDRLYDLVAEEIDYWAGEGVGKLIEKAMEVTPNDVERLWELLAMSRIAKEVEQA